MRKPFVLVLVSFLAMLLASWLQGDFTGSLVGGSDGMQSLVAFVFTLLGAAAGLGLVVGLSSAAWVWLMRAVPPGPAEDASKTSA